MPNESSLTMPTKPHPEWVVSDPAIDRPIIVDYQGMSIYHLQDDKQTLTTELTVKRKHMLQSNSQSNADMHTIPPRSPK